MPKVEDWARKSGVTFEAEKTKLIHFTRAAARYDSPAKALSFQGQEIHPSKAVKILGVVLDEKLKMDDHVAKVTTKAFKQCLAIKRLKGVRPRAMRQLYNATVVPITDYAASAWYGPSMYGVGRLLNMVDRVQRLGAQVITRAFKKVALPVLESEAGLSPVEFRLKRKVGKYLAGLFSLPEGNPATRCARVLRSQGGTWQSPLRHTWNEFAELVRPREAPKMETILPWTLPPWTVPAGEMIRIRERAEALRLAQRLPLQNTVFVDGAIREGICSVGVVRMVTTRQSKVLINETVARAKSFSVLATELLAILAGLEHLAIRPRGRREVWLATDSQRALDAIRTGAQRNEGQYIVRRIYEVLDEIATRGLSPRLAWVPAHSGVEGNEAADRAAKKAVKPGQKPDRDSRDRRRLVKTVTRVLLQSVRDEERKHGEERQRYGKYTWELDGAAPGRHTIGLYNALGSEQAAILIQCRSNHSRLKSYLYRLGREESGECECGTGQETVSVGFESEEL